MIRQEKEVWFLQSPELSLRYLPFVNGRLALYRSSTARTDKATLFIWWRAWLIISCIHTIYHTVGGTTIVVVAVHSSFHYLQSYPCIISCLGNNFHCCCCIFNIDCFLSRKDLSTQCNEINVPTYRVSVSIISHIIVMECNLPSNTSNKNTHTRTTHPRCTRTQTLRTPHRHTRHTTTTTIQNPTMLTPNTLSPITPIPTKPRLQPQLLTPPTTAKCM